MPGHTTSPPDTLVRNAPHKVYSGSADLLLEQLVQDIAERLRAAIRARGQAVLCVPGGSSPVALFKALSRVSLDWARVHVTLTDERLVPRAHPASNALLAQTHLLQNLAASAQLVPMVDQAQEPLPAASLLAEKAGARITAAGRADVLILGMGEDGHMASLFPLEPTLAQALAMDNPLPCMAIELTRPPAGAPFSRITQTLPQLLSARHIVLPLSGPGKLRTLKRAQAARSLALPISFVLHQDVTPVALWLST